MSDSNCRFCGQELKYTFVDLGLSPLSNSYIGKDKMDNGQTFYPLHTYVCDKCFLVQLKEYESPKEIFSDYAYFSSYSASWLNHAKEYVNTMINRFNLQENNTVVEIASNDGYLLQYFQEKKIKNYGIDPAENVAEVAKQKGIKTVCDFFGERLADRLANEGEKADLLLGNNVLAHVPNINDFVKGLNILIKDDGVITMEFPHLLNLIDKNQFDTIYHEHFSYLSLITVKEIFESHGLRIFDVQELNTHGGSLRIFACKNDCNKYKQEKNVEILINKEIEFGLDNIKTYLYFAEKVRKIKYDLLSLLIELKNEGKKIVGYGAPAKGNTLLNYCGIKNEFLDYTVDKSPYKQNLYLPGTQIAILKPEEIYITKPDYILILPWNLKDEIIEQLKEVRNWNAKFILPIPKVEVI